MRFDLRSKNSGWVSEASLKNGRAFGVLTRLDGKLHVLGGDDGSYDGHDDSDDDGDDDYKVTMMVIMMMTLVMMTMVTMMISMMIIASFCKA